MPCIRNLNTLRDLRRRRYLTSSAALLCSTPPPGPSIKWDSITRWKARWKMGDQCFTLKLMNVTRIGRQPRISGPVVNRANCTKSAAVTSKLKNYPKYKFQNINIQNINLTNHLLQRKLASDAKAVSEKVLHLKNLKDLCQRQGDNYWQRVDVVVRGEWEEVPSGRASLEVLGSSPEPFRRTEGCFCCKCKSSSVLKVTNALILATIIEVFQGICVLVSSRYKFTHIVLSTSCIFSLRSS